MGIKGIRAVRMKRGGDYKWEGFRENTYRKRQSNKVDITKHVNIRKQVTKQT
jgi:hypothetical protein